MLENTTSSRPDAEHRTGVVGRRWPPRRHGGGPRLWASRSTPSCRARKPCRQDEWAPDRLHPPGSLEPGVEGLGAVRRTAVGDNQANRWSCRHLGPDHVEKTAVDDGDGGVGVIEEIAEVVGPGQEVDRNRHRPDPHRPEKGGGKGGGVVEDQQDPVLPANPHVTKSRGDRSHRPRGDVRPTRRRHRR